MSKSDGSCVGAVAGTTIDVVDATIDVAAAAVFSDVHDFVDASLSTPSAHTVGVGVKSHTGSLLPMPYGLANWRKAAHR